MVLFAFSVQGEVEKYGAYVGIAAFIGLAILSLLYFSQAREVKRLREWAGRAPERAAEIEAQAVANAEAALRDHEAPAAAPAPAAVPVVEPEPAAVPAVATNGVPARELRPEEIAAAAFARAAGVAAPTVGGLTPPEPPTEIEVHREGGAEAASVAANEAAAAATEAAPAEPDAPAPAREGAAPAGPDAPAPPEPGVESAGPDTPTPVEPADEAEAEAEAPAANGHREEV